MSNPSAHNGIETDPARLQLRNVLALARRLKRKIAKGESVTEADIDHFIRFAENADVRPTILRACKPVVQREKGGE